MSQVSLYLKKKLDLRTILLITTITVFVAFAVSYSLVTPAFEGPDETAYYAATIHTYDDSYGPGRIFGLSTNQPLLYLITVSMIAILHPDADFYEGYLQRNPDWPHYPPLFHHGVEENFPFEGMSAVNHSLRFISIIFGVITLIFVYKIGEVVFQNNRWLPLYLTAVVSVIPTFVWMNSLMNTDPLLWMFSTISLYFFLKFVTSTQNRFIVLTAIFALLATSTKILALPLYPIIFIGLGYFFLSKKLAVKGIVKGGLIVSAITLIGFVILFSPGLSTPILETLTSDKISEDIGQMGDYEADIVDEFRIPFLSGFIQKSFDGKPITLERVTDPHHIHTRLVKFSISGLLGHGVLWAFNDLPVDIFFWTSIGAGWDSIWSPALLYHVADVFLVLSGIGIILVIRKRKHIDVTLDRHHFVIIFSAIVIVTGAIFYYWLFDQVGVARYTFLIISCYGIVITLGWYSIFNHKRFRLLLFSPLVFLALMSVQNMVVVEETYSYEMRDFAGDGIMDDIDTAPGLFSNDFRYIQNGNEITGTILNRIGDQGISNYNSYWGLQLTNPINDLNVQGISLRDAVKIIIKNESPNFEQILDKITPHLKNDKLEYQVRNIIEELESEGKIVSKNGFWEIPIQMFRITKDDLGVKIMNRGSDMQSPLFVELCNNTIVKEIPSESGIIFSCNSEGLDKFQQISYELILPQGIENGDLVQGQNRIEVYLIDNEVKRHITEKSETKKEFLFGDAFPIKRYVLKKSTFDELGFTVDMIKFVPDHIIDDIPTGKKILNLSQLRWGWFG